jgi:hypothetical protein
MAELKGRYVVWEKNHLHRQMRLRGRGLQYSNCGEFAIIKRA